MILIDKNNAVQKVYLTLLRDSEAQYLLVLHAPYTKKTYEIALGTNHSQHIERYDEFHLPQSSYQNIEAGRLTYEVWQVVDGNRVQLAEVGVATVKEHASLQDEYTAITPDETENDFIVYEN